MKFQLPEGNLDSRVQLLKAKKDIPFRRAGGAIEFAVPSVEDYEVAALYT